MFKWFDWSSIRDIPVVSRCSYLKEISDKERKKKEAYNYARTVAEDIQENVILLRQFFDITPKIGKFGICTKDDLNTVLTMSSDFFEGIKITFYVSHEGITGFEFTEEL